MNKKQLKIISQHLHLIFLLKEESLNFSSYLIPAYFSHYKPCIASITSITSITYSSLQPFLLLRGLFYGFRHNGSFVEEV
ncbi:hypothetical protein NQT72_19815 [Pseudoalteromonas carrageenovora]|uniref:hypothetical protein n=1 Tax=Pseudoalteromonas carrageenovora TaxID=227 RepID=UPI00211917F1|nr:hypothetical protein [Pseudoalteromonas carrageenovora]MCQ8891739.1 hypothetical protein [Pseudoalteromonas carrageenovora]